MDKLGLLLLPSVSPQHAALVLAPLTALKGPGKSLQWSTTLDSSFSATKLLLTAVPVLTHPVPGAALSLAVDPSDSHIGAVVQKRLRGSWSPLAFFSKKLSSAKSKYTPLQCSVTRYSVQSPHYSAQSPHYSAQSPHYSVQSPHYSAQSPHYSVQSPHCSVQSPHYSVLSHPTTVLRWTCLIKPV